MGQMASMFFSKGTRYFQGGEGAGGLALPTDPGAWNEGPTWTVGWDGAGDGRSGLLTRSQCSGRLQAVSLDSSWVIGARNREAAAYLLLNIEVGSLSSCPRKGAHGSRLVTRLLLDCL